MILQFKNQFAILESIKLDEGDTFKYHGQVCPKSGLPDGIGLALDQAPGQRIEAFWN